MTVFEVEQHPELLLLPRNERHAAQHEAGRALARRLLARCSGADRETIVIRTDEKGKPFTDDLCLSIAHSGPFICAAVGNEAVGIDIEALRDYDERIISRYFSPAEHAWLAGAESREQAQERFYTIWTTKEALLKRTGIGLAGLAECNTFAAMPDLYITQTIRDGYALCLAETIDH